MLRWAQILFLLLATGLLLAVILHAGSSSSPGAATETDGDPEDLLAPRPVSRPAPAFALPNRTGKLVRLSDFTGRWVLLNFWATWCEPCKDELPHLAALAEALAGQPLQVVLISVDDRFEDVDGLSRNVSASAASHKLIAAFEQASAMLQDRLANVTNLIDPQAATPKAFGTSKYPETYLIDPRGRLVAWFVGPKPWAHPDAIRYLKNAISPAPAAGGPGAQ